MGEEPAPVEVKNSEAIPVEIHTEHDTQAQTEARIVRASTRVDAAILRTEDQRRISGMWEATQRQIAILVVSDVLFVSTFVVLVPVILLLTNHPIDEAIKAASVGGLLFLTSTCSLVIGFYFGRTNHQRVGGDASPQDDQIGR